jgi:hypothetical protein
MEDPIEKEADQCSSDPQAFAVQLLKSNAL